MSEQGDKNNDDMLDENDTSSDDYYIDLGEDVEEEQERYQEDEESPEEEKKEEKKKGKKEEEINTDPNGGIPFFISLVSLLIFGTFNLICLPTLQTKGSFINWIRFFVGFFIGLAIAKYMIVDKLSVACHELKHYILAAFAGNKSKAMNVKGKSGYYTYSYTRETAKFNALIALAPYWFPLMTIFAAFLAIPAYYSYPELELAAIIVGIGVGADFIMNMRDISPVQTDLTNIRGGYKVALTFVAAMNLTILTLIAAWVSQGFDAFKILGAYVLEISQVIAQYYRGSN